MEESNGEIIATVKKEKATAYAYNADGSLKTRPRKTIFFPEVTAS